jgi:DNA adenine methylase
MAEFTENIAEEEKDFHYEKEEAYLQTYLNEIQSNSGAGFKRVIVSPLRYAGGKSKAIGLILDNLPKLREKRVVSPFFGGGSFELCLSQNLGIEVVGYDVFGMLTNFWDVLINHKTAFVAALKEFEINAEEFTKNRHILLSYWDKIKPATLVYKTKKVVELTEHEKNMLDDDRILQAVYYYYNMSLSYGPMFLGWPSSN